MRLPSSDYIRLKLIERIDTLDEQLRKTRNLGTHYGTEDQLDKLCEVLAYVTKELKSWEEVLKRKS